MIDKEQFVPYKIAVELAKLGYDIEGPNLYFHSWGNVAKSNQKYMEIGSFWNLWIDVDQTACFDAPVCNQPKASDKLTDHFIYAPTFRQAFDWIADTYDMEATVIAFQQIDFETEEVTRKYTGRVDNWNNIISTHDGTGLQMPEHYHFEESSKRKAELKCFDKLIELIKQKQTGAV